ncbi:unnamed protein product [Kuraishia capsulata CBS 1993]|uniref:Sec20 C-terminal domain-containing protein n=1 Tax=Kuraishia capsulata CBS 1993 TaxID=1382522 RepID=W6MPS6_9ASCO|nr:uncharacterized protein KUCA_T00004635001 [Kuraishia capsulata CBS 1993]CDK28651.1 unnamed protein product [Kuraishia capsulata CBS 1993]
MDQPLESNLEDVYKATSKIQNIIRQLKSDHVFENIQEESFSAIRTEYVEQALKLFRESQELLDVVKFKLESGSREFEKRLDYIVQYDTLTERIGDLRVDLRKAQLVSVEREEEVIRNQREKFFSNNYQNPAGDENGKEDLFKTSGKKDSIANATFGDKLLDKNMSITASLQKSRQMMEATVMRSELNVEELEASTRNVQHLGSQYEFFNDILAKTNGLVKEINKSSSKERREIYMAISFFGACVAWVVWRRLLKRPVMLLLWTIFKTFSMFRFIYGKASSVDASAEPETLISSEISKTIVKTVESITESISESWGTMDIETETFASVETPVIA